ncbi:hypothetical protein [Nonomuraea sp. PA05]|uniref:hypothetical protein n=1 Tax=Nonomuraea sp. PA05 TaxID=2604466 RepID=UPI0016522E56|nr:hypothetical protein [Nonomuraea sp. PA05]
MTRPTSPRSPRGSGAPTDSLSAAALPSSPATSSTQPSQARNRRSASSSLLLPLKALIDQRTARGLGHEGLSGLVEELQAKERQAARGRKAARGIGIQEGRLRASYTTS